MSLDLCRAECTSVILGEGAVGSSVDLGGARKWASDRDVSSVPDVRIFTKCGAYIGELESVGDK